MIQAGSSTLNSHIEALHSRYYFKGRTRLVTSIQQLHQNELATEKVNNSGIVQRFLIVFLLFSTSRSGKR